MTLIVTVNGRESIWMLADRRLSYQGQPPKEDGRKVMFLETTDGVAILGYAGLGATIGGTEPSDWMSAVLRGRNLPLEHALEVLAGAMERQFPRHLLTLPKKFPAVHNIIIPSFVEGEVRLYTIDLELSPDRKAQRFLFTRHMRDPLLSGAHPPPRIGLAGSGLSYLIRDKRWVRKLLRLIHASDAKQVSPLVVADELASINELAHLNTPDGTVGPRCIVAWRHNKLGVHKGGGGQEYYDGKNRIGDSGILPCIANGFDVQAIAQGVLQHLGPQMERMVNSLRAGQSIGELDHEAMNAYIAKLPSNPDESLN